MKLADLECIAGVIMTPGHCLTDSILFIILELLFQGKSFTV
jgi:hypothetical protein